MPDTQEISMNEQERYTIRSKHEIERLLGELAKRPEIVTGYHPNGDDYTITAILGVLPERNAIILDPGVDERRNQRLIQAGRMTCVTQHQRVMIRFDIEGIKQAHYQGAPVFVAPIPDSLLRMQRRDYFRVATPQLNPLLCRIPLGTGTPLELPLADISGGGLCLLDKSRQLESVIGMRLEECQLLFPDHGTITLPLEVRSIVVQHSTSGTTLQRIGCRFTELPNDKAAFIQRYILKLQVAQKNVTSST